MASRKPAPPKRNNKVTHPGEAVGTLLSTMSGPSTAQPAAARPKGAQAALAEKFAGTGAVAASVPHNPLKAGEHGRNNAVAPPAGTPIEPPSPLVGASTVSESQPLREARHRPGAAGRQRNDPSARRRARRLGWSSAHD